jgi:hypothetical protein
MPACRSGHGGHRHLLVVNAFAGTAGIELGAKFAWPLVYVSRYLFASTGRMANYWFWVELLGTIIFVALAVLGLKRSPWFLAVGIVAHGLAWDTWHYRNSTYIPDWYATACLAVDLAFGAYVHAFPRIRARRALR